MISHTDAIELLVPEQVLTSELLTKIEFVGFGDPTAAIQTIRRLAENDDQRSALAQILPGLLYALSEASDSDRSVRNFQRYFSCVENRGDTLNSLVDQPRAVEILIRLFVGSQFLTEILLRNPTYLDRLTQHKRLAEFKSREEFIQDARQVLQRPGQLDELKKGLRVFQQWEILRIAACDTFGVMDLKTVTLQLSLLADAIVQVALENILRLSNLEENDFAVIAFGKLGGLELNYSSDIDLVFVCQKNADRYFNAGQKLIQVLSDFTGHGFLYRVDMRLRPWGNSGPLVTSGEAYQSYFVKHAQLWERQALLKARTIAGAYQLGDELLESLRHEAFQVEAEEVRMNVLSMKNQIEENISKKSPKAEGVKGGPGGIRDIEFLVQYLQFIHGNQFPRIRRVGTQEALIALSDADLLNAEEFRVLSNAYLILRTIEHSLQIMHNQPEYFLPESKRELAYLARRLDFPDAEHFLVQFEKHTYAVKDVFDRHVRTDLAKPSQQVQLKKPSDSTAKTKHEFPRSVVDGLVSQLNDRKLVVIACHKTEQSYIDFQAVGYDHVGDLPVLCGLLLVYGFDVISGTADVQWEQTTHSCSRVFVNRFLMRSSKLALEDIDASFWNRFAEELNSLFQIAMQSGVLDAQKKLIAEISQTLRSSPQPSGPLLPIEITIEKDPASQATILYTKGEDVPGFLFELTNAITLSGLSIERMFVQSQGAQASDTLYVVDPESETGLDELQGNRLRATVALVKHFTHLLPHSANPERALVHFRDLLGNLLQQVDWLDQLQTLQQPEVLAAVTRLLGFSDFLWEDFLRLQHENLFPVVTDISGLQQPQTREQYVDELDSLLELAAPEEAVELLNEFKDRAMMRVDMRHILGLQTEFGMFSKELTAVAEAVVESAVQLVHTKLKDQYGEPTDKDGALTRLSVVALGKCGGEELGYASDIELMFIYEADGRTNGLREIRNSEYFQKLVSGFQQTIRTRHKKIFEIDLRLRPYGKAGALAVSKEAFSKYFSPEGPAWPYERQALVKLRPIAGDEAWGKEIVRLRDRLIYTAEGFDLSAMRAMREKQIRQFVEPGTFHAKLSPGALVDCEYFVQGLQLTFGHLAMELRAPNTRAAMKQLELLGLLTNSERIQLRDAYRFLRRLIDGMRMVRGDATDLAIPHHNSEQFEFLAKRLGIHKAELHAEIERQTCCVIDLIVTFEHFIERGRQLMTQKHLSEKDR